MFDVIFTPKVKSHNKSKDGTHWIHHRNALDTPSTTSVIDNHDIKNRLDQDTVPVDSEPADVCAGNRGRYCDDWGASLLVENVHQCGGVHCGPGGVPVGSVGGRPVGAPSRAYRTHVPFPVARVGAEQIRARWQ